MDFQPGQQLLHYRLTEKIGEGGMGVVWLARDTSLGRDVAIKMVPQALAGEPERMARFDREAKLLASLDHPNIAAVYGLHECEGRRFIAMEYVPGEDLAQRLARGPLTIEDAVEVARRVAGALESAHEQGVIHRDLKPANIKWTPDGKVKVLDLGLAKALATETSGEAPSASLSPTITSAGTVAGTLLGTAAYMSPEQAKGRAVDRRADIWAFGVVLYEILTGRRLFEAETISETLAAVLRDEIDFSALPADTPAPVLSLLRRCLERDPRTRLRDIGEARIVLSSDTLSSGAGAAVGLSAQPAVAASPKRGRAFLPWVLVALLAVVAAASLWQATNRPDRNTELLSLVAPIPPDLQLPQDQMGIMALSPDGKALAVVLQHDNAKKLYVRALDSADLVEMPDTEDAATPFFSPDGQWIAFFADAKLKKVPASGGTPVTLCDAEGNNRGATWGTDDVITFAPHFAQPLMRVSGAGGEPTSFTTIDADNGERTHRWPQAVADEDLVLFTVGMMDSPESYDDARIDAVRPSTGERRTVLERASMARYVATGHLVFGREGFLFAVPFDIDKLEVRGSPVPVMENVMGMRASGVVHAEIARNGLLAYVAGAPRSRRYRLVWRNRDGTKEPLALPVGGYVNPRISPDRKRVAFQLEGANTFDIWALQLEQETLSRLTFEGDNVNPVWSPDGRRIAFGSVRDNALKSVYIKASDGTGEAEKTFSPDQLERDAGAMDPRGWTADQRELIVEFSDKNGQNIGKLEDGNFQVFLDTPAMEAAPQLSPNGKWLAYQSDETGEIQVFVRAYRESGGKWQVSTTGGVNPRWSPDGSELFFRDLSTLQAVRIEESGGGLSIGRPRVVFDDVSALLTDNDYDVFDANRFLFCEEVGDDTAPAGVTVVVNWLDELQRRVPQKR